MSVVEEEKGVVALPPPVTTESGPPPPPASSPEEKGERPISLEPRPERTPTFQDYLVSWPWYSPLLALWPMLTFLQRIFRYATKWDFAAYFAGAVASIGAGITLPLLNVLFGEQDQRCIETLELQDGI